MSTPFRHRVGRIFAVGALAATAAVAIPLAASATAPSASLTPPTTTASSSTPPTTTSSHSSTDLAKARTRCLQARSRRSEVVAGDLTKVQHATRVSSKVRLEVASQLTQVQGELQHAKPAIESAGTPSALRNACKSMITDTRVFLLYGPKTHAVVATNRLAIVDQRIARIQGHVDQVVARAEKRGVSADKIADAKQHFADALSEVHDAHGHIDGLAAELTPVTPAQVNDHSADATLTKARSDLKAAAGDAAKARSDVQSIRQDLSMR